MKHVFLLLALLVMSCEKDEKESPIKIIGHELLISGEGYGSLYRFTARNEGDAIVDSFTVFVTMVIDGENVETSSGKCLEETIPFQTQQVLIRFQYVVTTEAVEFRYKVK